MGRPAAPPPGEEGMIRGYPPVPPGPALSAPSGLFRGRAGLPPAPIRSPPAPLGATDDGGHFSPSSASPPLYPRSARALRGRVFGHLSPACPGRLRRVPLFPQAGVPAPGQRRRRMHRPQPGTEGAESREAPGARAGGPFPGGGRARPRGISWPRASPHPWRPLPEARPGKGGLRRGPGGGGEPKGRPARRREAPSGSPAVPPGTRAGSRPPARAPGGVPASGPRGLSIQRRPRGA